MRDILRSRPRALAGGLATGLVLALMPGGPPIALAAQGGAAAAVELPRAASPSADATGRDVVLVRRECTSTIHRQEVTLFANGTVRVRQGPPGEEAMSLGELPPDEVDALVASFREEDLSEGEGSGGPDGEWVEVCRLEMPVLAMPAPDGPSPGAGPRTPTAEGEGTRHRRTAATTFTYGRFDSLPLGLSRATAAIDRLAARAGVRRGLPVDYRPRPGDVLRRADGVLFAVVRETVRLGDDAPRGWELQGVVQPLALYIAEGDVPAEFVELVSRAGTGR